MELILILGILLIFVIYYFASNAKKSTQSGLKEIPLVAGWPIVGIIPKIEPPMYNYFVKLSKKYGPIFRIRFGMREMIVLNNFDWMQKTLINQGDVFSGRFRTQQCTFVCHNSGIIFTDGNLWNTQRSFVSKVLRDFGLGMSRSVEIVQSECWSLLENLMKSEGQTVDTSFLFCNYTSNVIGRFIMNKPVSSNDILLSLMVKMQNTIVKQKDLVQLFLLSFPILDNWNWFYKLILFLTSREKLFEEIHNRWKEEISIHRNNLHSNLNGEDLIDRFLIKQQKVLEKEKTVKSFTDWQLIRNALELFIAGFDTTASTLVWGLLFMAKYPDIQEKVYNEIEENIGLERLPTMNDKKSMNFTQAVIDEILRLSSISPLSIFHRTMKDTTVDGYFIRENTLIIPNIFACHVDQNIWERPMEFYPNHFLSVNNNGELKYNSRVELIPFSVGKRKCLGESLARIELFIFFTAIIQRFRVSFSNPLSDVEYQKVLLGIDGALRCSTVNDYVFVSRIKMNS